MSDSDGKKTLGLRGGPRSANVTQSFSHGRTKSVVVETKRKRVMVPKTISAKTVTGSAPVKSQSGKRPDGVSDVEMERRLKAVQAAKARESEESAARKADEKARIEEREKRRFEQEQKDKEQRGGRRICMSGSSRLKAPHSSSDKHAGGTLAIQYKK